MRKIEALSPESYKKIEQHLFAGNMAAFDQFFAVLKRKLDRIIDRVIVVPLFGSSTTFPTITDANRFIDSFDAVRATGEFQKYELTVVFSNGDQIQGMFATKERAQEFLGYVSA